MLQPRYCCAILIDSRGNLVLERRSPHDPIAGGMLACFGGGRDEGETPEETLSRELREELGFTPDPFDRDAVAFVLHTPMGEAWFYQLRGPEEGEACAVEPDCGVEWIAERRLLTHHAHELAAWHRVMFQARAAGHRTAAAT
ncbi:MAG TPA: NUDIX hydrolase [Phycisphaerales bacterium]